MIKKIDYFYIISIIFFSFFINWKYSKYGVFPIDTFLHYDSAYRILNGEHPIKDYWAVSGIFVDYLQAFFFKIFGVNWHSYILHSSTLNVILSILTFHFLININLKKKIFEYNFYKKNYKRKIGFRKTRGLSRPVCVNSAYCITK